MAGGYGESINYNVPKPYYAWTEDFEGDVTDWTAVDLTYTPTTWHPDTFQAYGRSGKSWWMGEPAIKGYRDSWYLVMDSPEIILPLTGLTLTFVMNRNVEAPGGEPAGYDGWDGCNVRISTDGGTTWTVLTSPTPAYTCTSMFSFGYEHAEEQGVPGWGGSSGGWVNVSFDISAYANDTVRIRWAFASDPAYCTVDDGYGNPVPGLFGWQIDSINVAGEFTNNGEDTTGFICKCLAHGGFWNLTEESSHSATHSFNCREDKPRVLRNALVSSPIILPNENTIPLTYWVYCDMPDGDGDGDDTLEDLYRIGISRDDATTWEDFGYDYGYNGSDLDWVLRETRLVEGSESPLDLFEYAGDAIRIRWQVVTDDNDDGGSGTGLYIDDINITVSVEESQVYKPTFNLFQNAPNPAIGKTTIQFAIDKPCNVSLKIYSLSGQLVRTLVDKQETPGLKSAVWDGKDFNSKRVSTGIYFYELNADNLKRTKKLILVK